MHEATSNAILLRMAEAKKKYTFFHYVLMIFAIVLLYYTIK